MLLKVIRKDNMKYTIELPDSNHNFVTQRQFVVGKIYKCFQTTAYYPKPCTDYLGCYVWLEKTLYFRGKQETGYLLVTNGCFSDGTPMEYLSTMKSGLEFSDGYKFVEMPIGTKIYRNELIVECR